ncbi:MAG: helix-turn-helix domain-containing protein [Anaerolineae bacterium]|nr:helix-turn-helix domain-containing protein [Anaerolineae bacterium]NIQ82732.1 helix-turn-helix domain-containing protein [Anaerolineae bacterium]
MCIYVRELTPAELAQVRDLARSSDTVTHRHARAVLLSAQRVRVLEIAERLDYCARAVRNLIKAFNKDGVKAVSRRKSPGRPRICDQEARDAILDLLHKPPSTFGIESALWTTKALAEVAVRQGIVPQISDETIRIEIKRARMRWQRAKRWTTSSDPDYDKKRASLAFG